MLGSIQKTFRNLGEFVFPASCRICRERLSFDPELSTEGENGGLICSTCEKVSSRLVAPFCAVCRQVLPEQTLSCSNCQKPEGIGVFGFGLFDLYNRELLHRFKYYGDRPTGDFLGQGLGNLVASSKNQHSWDAVVPVPLHWTRKWSRGFNQSSILAEAVSKTLGAPVLAALRRVKRTRDQTKLSRQKRLENVRGAFRVVKDVQGKKLLLLDDVTTTGATLEECRRVLIAAGAAEISAAVVALAYEN